VRYVALCLLQPSISNGEVLSYIRVLHMHRFGGTKWFLEKLTLEVVNVLVARSQLDTLLVMCCCLIVAIVVFGCEFSVVMLSVQCRNAGSCQQHC
jgi:uncharacterized membrane protein